jgi:ankyrin repeat protein
MKLLKAVEKGDEIAVKLLVEKKADIEAKDTGGQTPLLTAVRKRHGAVVKPVVEKGAARGRGQ